MESNFNLSTGFVENALALHLFAISSFTGWPVFAIFVIISSVAESPISAGYLALIVCFCSCPGGEVDRYPS